MRIDLHTHSTASDGTDSPAELMHLAAHAGLDVVALTDHDTTAGWLEAAAAVPAGMHFVPGAEWSCVSPDGRGGHCSVHLLGYLFDPRAPALVAEQARLRTERRERLHRMTSRMSEDGLPIDADALLAGLPEDAPAGRPHLAMALVDAGIVPTVDQAFADYLNTGARYHLPRADTPVDRALEMIVGAGGVAVLAHPFARSRGPVVTAEVITWLAGLGLAGLEVDHPDHDPATRAELRAIAGQHKLVVTGSSDYHGTNKSIKIGQETTDDGALAELARRATGTAVITGKGGSDRDGGRAGARIHRLWRMVPWCT